MIWNETLQILAEGETTGGRPPTMWDMLPMFAMMAMIFYFLLFRPQGKERKRREAMLSAIKKNDKVVTAGGIIGTVTSTRDDEITLKVDESTNTKITFSSAAIQKVVTVSAGDDEKK